MADSELGLGAAAGGRPAGQSDDGLIPRPVMGCGASNAAAVGGAPREGTSNVLLLRRRGQLVCQPSTARMPQRTSKAREQAVLFVVDVVI